MNKATVRIPYSPAAIDFWTSHWALRAPLQALEARETLNNGDMLRVIMIKEQDQDVAVLQGPEIDVVMHALETSLAHTDDPIAREILRRFAPIVGE